MATKDNTAAIKRLFAKFEKEYYAPSKDDWSDRHCSGFLKISTELVEKEWTFLQQGWTYMQLPLP